MKKLDKIQKLIWENSSSMKLPEPPDKDKVWLRLEQLMEIPTIDHHRSINPSSMRRTKIGIWSLMRSKLFYAVSLSIIFMISLPFAYNFFTTETHSTMKSECRTIPLVDGSKVELNCDSKIKYNNDFNTDHRTIHLSGEAYFDISKGKSPFIIKTDFGQVTVIGTKFNIRTRYDGFEVGVNEGIVKVFQNENEITLTKGELLNIHPQSDHENIKNIVYQNYPDWLNDKLVCDQTRLIELCDEIERKFDISFKFYNKELKEIKISGVIDTKNLESVLSTISLLTQHEFKFNGETCTII